MKWHTRCRRTHEVSLVICVFFRANVEFKPLFVDFILFSNNWKCRLSKKVYNYRLAGYQHQYQNNTHNYQF
jgi:hypothetical protein